LSTRIIFRCWLCATAPPGAVVSVSQLFSPERQAVIRARYPTEEPAADIARACNKLSGPMVTGHQIRKWAAAHKVRRPRENNESYFIITPERAAIIREKYPVGFSNEELLKELNLLPGPPVSRRQMHNWANGRGLKRPTWYISEACSTSRTITGAYGRNAKKQYRALPEPLPPAAKPPKPKAAAPIAVPLRIIYQWGGFFDLPLPQRGDVDAVNRAMRSADPTHPGFRVTSDNLPYSLGGRE